MVCFCDLDLFDQCILSREFLLIHVCMPFLNLYSCNVRIIMYEETLTFRNECIFEFYVFFFSLSVPIHSQ